MAPKYNLLFVPNFKDRIKISKLRSKICKQVHSTQALQYPVHMSLISGGFYVKDYSKFEQSLKQLCKNEKILNLKTQKFTTADTFWTGVHIIRTNEITKFQKKLQKLRNKFAISKEKHKFGPLHITLAFPAKVDDLKTIKFPVRFMKLERITIVKKDKEMAPYRIFKHIKIS